MLAGISLININTVCDKQGDVACDVVNRGNLKHTEVSRRVPLINIGPELDQTFGDWFHVADDGLGQSREHAKAFEIPLVVKGVRCEIDGALHDE